MKRKKFEMEWFVYVYGLNCSGFRKMNISEMQRETIKSIHGEPESIMPKEN